VQSDESVKVRELLRLINENYPNIHFEIGSTDLDTAYIKMFSSEVITTYQDYRDQIQNITETNQSYVETINSGKD